MADIDENSAIKDQLDAATKRIAGKSVPSRLQTITDRHLTKLMTLVESMRAAGVEEDIVRHSVHELVRSYEAELVDVMTALAREERD